MKSLRLSPLPTHRYDDQSASLMMEREGFVDESVVTALMCGGRSMAYPGDLALAADDQDFAGWRFSKAIPSRPAEVPPQVIDAIVRRAAPPIVDAGQTLVSHQGSRRVWLAGLAGVVSTLLVSGGLLLFTRSSDMGFKTLLGPGLTGNEQLPLQEPASMQPRHVDLSLLGQ